MAPSLTPASTHYALVIDAGSSGSRLQIYSWRDPDLERAEIVNEVRAATPEIQATFSADSTTDGRPWAESSKAAQGRAWWWPPFLSRKGKGKEREYEASELERRALRRLVRVSKGVEGEEWVKRVEPGISSITPEGVQDYLAPLLSHALQHIPPSQHGHTPIYIYATAGMRLKPEKEQQAILQSTCDLLRTQYPFHVGRPTDAGPCGENIRVISGEEEGMWGWVAVNYLMDGFGHAPPYDGVASPSTSLLPLAPLADAPPNSASDSVTPVDVQHHSPTFGFLDMGGASTQLAFSPTASELDRSGFPPDQLRQVSLRLLSGESVEWPVFVASWLGFGTNQARERYIETLLSQSRESSDSIPDPCLPVDLVVPTSLDDSTPSLVGTGNFGQCLKRLTPLLDHAHPCPTNHCLFGGQPTPHIDFSREDQRGFIGVSEYWYTAHQVLGLGGVWDWGEWEKGMNGFCAREWQGIEDQVDRDETWQGSAIEKSRLQMQCFKGAWISNVLHEGIGIPRLIDSGGRDTLTGGAVGDTNAEAERRAREKGLMGESKKYFQSMDEVDNTAISWTLGKMVIEASKAVPPRSSAVENAWRARLPSLGFGGVERAMQHVGLQAIYAYAVFGAVLLVVLYNWVQRRKRFPLSSPRVRARKSSVSDGSTSPAGGNGGGWMSMFSDSDEESSGMGMGASNNRSRTAGRVRLWSLRLAHSIRRGLPFAHRGYDTHTLPRVGSGRPSFISMTRPNRHASMPLHAQQGHASSTFYSPSGYPSQPPSPRPGVHAPFFPSSEGVALTVPIARPGSTSPEPRRVGVSQSSADLASMPYGMMSVGMSPPRGSASVRPSRTRQNSSPASGASGGLGQGSGQGQGQGQSQAGGGSVPPPSGSGWNDPPMSMLAMNGNGSDRGVNASQAGEGTPDGTGTAIAGTGGILTPSAGGMSRQSSRVNLSEMGLNQRGSRMAGGGS